MELLEEIQNSSLNIFSLYFTRYCAGQPILMKSWYQKMEKFKRMVDVRTCFAKSSVGLHQTVDETYQEEEGAMTRYFHQITISKRF